MKNVAKTKIKDVTEIASVQYIPNNHWLQGQKYDWFVKGFNFAALQNASAIPLSKLTHDEVYHLVSEILRGSGLILVKSFHTVEL